MDDTTRRDLLKRSAFVAPAMLTLATVPAFARSGSTQHEKEHKEKDKPNRKRD